MSEKLSKADFNFIAELAKKEFGLSLSENKSYLVQNRLSKRLMEYGCSDYKSYIELLASQEQEMVNFINSLTTNKTEFFREIDHFTYLSELALPQWEKLNPNRRQVYIWCAASSTGEEPVTLAMVLHRFAKQRNLSFRILATDVDTAVLDFAQQGIYPEHRVADVPESFRKDYFMSGNGSWKGQFRVVPELLQSIKYRRFNLVKDSLQENIQFDFIFLRNVLIYFDQNTIKLVIDKLLKHLSPAGQLFVGHSESLHAIASKLVSVAPAIYRQRNLRL